MIQGYTSPAELARVRNLALGVGVLFSLMIMAGALLDRDRFFHGYLVGFVFWTGISVGSLALLMLQHLTGGAWGLVIRRVLEASTRALPLMLLLFIPIALGLKHIYPWTNAAVMNATPALQKKAASFLNPSFFILRTFVYFALWSGAAIFLNWLSLQQDRAAGRTVKKRMQMISGPGLVVVVVCITFAAVDWVMSLDPTWYSTIFGLIFLAAWALSALAFTILAMSWLSAREPMNAVVQPSHSHDWGNLTLALTMLWTYFAFSQYLIIWSGNLPEETTWYIARNHGGWGLIALTIAILQFGFPFLMLLSRTLKKSAQKLALLAALILVMRIVDVIWLVEPTYSPGHFVFNWMDYVAPIAMGGLWIGVFAWQLEKRPLLPINDPQLEQALTPAHGH
jgi:magnesium-transporting ATPase (P-type)